jgi:tetratricopeptide (TPR) repeat protein
MKKIVMMTIIILCTAFYGFCDISKKIQEADTLFDTFKYTESQTLLMSLMDKAKGNKEKADVYWRLSRVTLYLGDEAEDAGKSQEEILVFFEKGDEYADKALEADSNNHLAYYWKSSNIGRWGQVKGIVNALFKAEPMKELLEKAININPKHADSYYVLGELYDELPGFPVSFGNIDYAVSLGRKSVILHEKDIAAGREEKTQYGYYTKLAKHLEKRGWSASKRKSKLGKKEKSHKKETDVLKKSFYFEATVTIKDMSDKEEALEIINKVINDLEKKSNRDKTENDDLKDAKELKSSWK